ncbi:MAG: DUF1540 domain-containing protein [Myxococcota bacterium]
MKLSLPVVSMCTVNDCAYNREAQCHAAAITIGDGLHPACDTYFHADKHRGDDGRAGVGACKIVGCIYNEDFACVADAIEVGHHGDHADCLTFCARGA